MSLKVAKRDNNWLKIDERKYRVFKLVPKTDHISAEKNIDNKENTA